MLDEHRNVNVCGQFSHQIGPHQQPLALQNPRQFINYNSYMNTSSEHKSPHCDQISNLLQLQTKMSIRFTNCRELRALKLALAAVCLSVLLTQMSCGALTKGLQLQGLSDESQEAFVQSDDASIHFQLPRLSASKKAAAATNGTSNNSTSNSTLNSTSNNQTSNSSGSSNTTQNGTASNQTNSTNATGDQVRILSVDEGVLYQNMQLAPRTFQYFKHQVPANKNYTALLNNQYLYVRVDGETGDSNPQIFISKTVQTPKSQYESDQYCIASGSNLCFLRRGSLFPTDTVYFSVRCIEGCKFTLRLGYSTVQVISENLNSFKLTLDARAAQVFSYSIPEVSSDGPTQAIQMIVETLQQTNPIKLQFSPISNLTMLQERSQDFLVENGKGLKVSSDEIGWCTGCSVFFVLSVRAAGNYYISTRSSARRDLLTSQTWTLRAANQFQRECFGFEVTRPQADLLLQVNSLQGDVDLQVVYRNPLNVSQETQLLSSDLSVRRGLILKASERQRALKVTTGVFHLCANPYTDSSFQIFATQQFAESRYLARGDYQYNFNLDPQGYSYFLFQSPQFVQPGQLEVSVNTFTAGAALPRAFFRVCQSSNIDDCFLSDALARGQSEGGFNMSEVTKMANRSQSANQRVGLINHDPNMCPLSTSCIYMISVFNPDSSLPQRLSFKVTLLDSDPTPLPLFTSFTDQIAQNSYKYFQVDISPLQLSTWLISSLRVSLTSFNGRAELYLLSNLDQLPYKYQTFAAVNMTVPKLSSDVSNGSLSLGLPKLGNYELRARSISPWAEATYIVDGKDLTGMTLVIGVYGAARTQYQVRVSADYRLNQPQYYDPNNSSSYYSSNTTSNSTNSSQTNSTSSGGVKATATNTITNTSTNTTSNSTQGKNSTTNQTTNGTTNQTSNTSTSSNSTKVNPISPPPPINLTTPKNSTNLTVYPTLLSRNRRYFYTATSNSTDFILYYYPAGQAPLRNPIHFANLVTSITTNGSVSFNVSYGPNQLWTNNRAGLTLMPDQIVYNPGYYFTITYRADFSKTNRTVVAQQLFPGQSISANTSNSTNTTNGTSRPININSILLNATVMMGVYEFDQPRLADQIVDLNTSYNGYANNSFVVYRHYLLDTNGTYKFAVNNGFGKPFIMEKNGALNLQTFDFSDDTTYDFINNFVDYDDYSELLVTRAMRENANFRCKNSSYTLRGGNENCTLFFAVQCRGFCTFNFTLTLVEAAQRTVKIPTLLKLDASASDIVQRGANQMYYTPFVRGDMNDSAIILRRLDFAQWDASTFLVAKVISNGHLPYFNWSYPFYNSANASAQDLFSRTVNSSYEVLELSASFLSSKCPNASSCILLISVINQAASNTSLSFSNYNLQLISNQYRLPNTSHSLGFVKNSQDLSYYWMIVNNTQPWKYLITVAASTTLQDVDVYVTFSTGEKPSLFNFDVSGDKIGNDAISISSDMPLARAINSQAQRMLVWVGVRARQNDTNFQILVWGPQPYEQQLQNFTDLRSRQPLNITLPSKILKPSSNYRVLRLFNYGMLDFSVNFTMLEGSGYILFGRDNFKHTISNSYFNVPLAPTMSKLPMLSLSKPGSAVIRVNSTSNPELYCTFCWVYFTVFQNNSLNPSTLNVNLTENSSALDSTPTLSLNSAQTLNISAKGQILQRKFNFDAKDLVLLQLTSRLQSSYSAYVSMSPTNYTGAGSVFNFSGKGNITFFLRQTTLALRIGAYYFLTIVANDAGVSVQARLQQDRQIDLLKEGAPLYDKMNTQEDFVKYYYFLPPVLPANTTYTLSIASLTPSFMPSVYLQRNDIINQSYSLAGLQYPSINQSSQSFESYYYQSNSLNSSSGSQNRFSYSFNVSATTRTLNVSSVVQQTVLENRTVQVNVTQNVTNKTTGKNTTVTTLQNVTTQVNTTKNVTVYFSQVQQNQTYFTMAVYWNNFGLSDIQQAEFEIQLSSGSGTQTRLQAIRPSDHDDHPDLMTDSRMQLFSLKERIRNKHRSNLVQ